MKTRLLHRDQGREYWNQSHVILWIMCKIQTRRVRTFVNMAAAYGLQSIADVLLVFYFDDIIDDVKFTVSLRRKLFKSNISVLEV